MLLSSHMLVEVEQICDRVGVIQNGNLVREGTVGELRGGSELLVRANPLDKAQQVADGLPEVKSVSAAKGSLRITAAETEGSSEKQDAERWAASVNARLVQEGVEVSELRPSEQSLEEVFLELTGEPAEEEES